MTLACFDGCNIGKHCLVLRSSNTDKVSAFDSNRSHLSKMIVLIGLPNGVATPSNFRGYDVWMTDRTLADPYPDITPLDDTLLKNPATLSNLGFSFLVYFTRLRSRILKTC